MAAVVVKSDAEEQRGLMRERLMIVGKGSRGMDAKDAGVRYATIRQPDETGGRSAFSACLMGWAGLGGRGTGGRGRDGSRRDLGWRVGEWVGSGLNFPRGRACPCSSGLDWH